MELAAPSSARWMLAKKRSESSAPPLYPALRCFACQARAISSVPLP